MEHVKPLVTQRYWYNAMVGKMQSRIFYVEDCNMYCNSTIYHYFWAQVLFTNRLNESNESNVGCIVSLSSQTVWQVEFINSICFLKIF